MAKLGIISPIEEADWCAPIVVVQKLNGDVRICVDLTQLNKSVRERHMMPTVDESFASLAGVKWFSTLDANKG